jgi:excisionase family DNA binding protein
MAMNDEKMLDVKEAADRLNVSPFTIRRMLSERSLQFRRIGSGRGRLRISERDLQQYQEQRTVTAVAA